MGALFDLTSLVRRKCPGIMDIMMLDALASSYREFCNKSEFLTSSLTVASADESTPVVISPQADHTVLKVESVIETQTSGKLVELYLNEDYTRPKSNGLQFNKPRQALKITYVEVPTAIADPMTMTIDDDIINRYGDVIAIGAAMELRLMPAQPWTEAGLAEVYSREFIEGCRNAYRDKCEEFTEFRNQPRKHQFF